MRRGTANEPRKYQGIKQCGHKPHDNTVSISTNASTMTTGTESTNRMVNICGVLQRRAGNAMRCTTGKNKTTKKHAPPQDTWKMELSNGSPTGTVAAVRKATVKSRKGVPQVQRSRGVAVIPWSRASATTSLFHTHSQPSGGGKNEARRYSSRRDERAAGKMRVGWLLTACR